MKKSYLLTGLLAFSITFSSFGQIVPFYPIEIFFNPCGYTNQLPGCKPDLYTTFSSLKVVLNKDIPSPERFANTLSFVGNLELYHDFTKARDYTPLSLNPVLKIHFFANDIFTPGLELNGNLESLPGTDLNGNVFRYSNFRIRIRPFHYLIVTPNIIFEELITYGRSYNTEKTVMRNVEEKPVQVSWDYYILRYDATVIYLSKFHTRFFLAPFCYYNQFLDIAISESGKINSNGQKLRESGYGCALGLRYSTFTWGFTEAVFEYENNRDLTSGSNSYQKFKINTKWENQYFTERFGYAISFDYIKHDFERVVLDYKQSSDMESELGRQEIRFDVMPIFNLNRNVSLRPEFDFFYKDMPGSTDIKKFRYWLHLHVLF